MRYLAKQTEFAKIRKWIATLADSSITIESTFANQHVMVTGIDIINATGASEDILLLKFGHVVYALPNSS